MTLKLFYENIKLDIMKAKQILERRSELLGIDDSTKLIPSTAPFTVSVGILGGFRDEDHYNSVKQDLEAFDVGVAPS